MRFVGLSKAACHGTCRGDADTRNAIAESESYRHGSLFIKPVFKGGVGM